MRRNIFLSLIFYHVLQLYPLIKGTGKNGLRFIIGVNIIKISKLSMTELTNFHTNNYIYIYIYIYTFIRHEDRIQQRSRQTLELIPQQHSNALNIQNHTVLVIKCSYTTHVNSLKFMRITDTPYE